jgi:hypothetical protein
MKNEVRRKWKRKRKSAILLLQGCCRDIFRESLLLRDRASSLGFAQEMYMKGATKVLAVVMIKVHAMAELMFKSVDHID